MLYTPKQCIEHADEYLREHNFLQINKTLDWLHRHSDLFCPVMSELQPISEEEFDKLLQYTLEELKDDLVRRVQFNLRLGRCKLLRSSQGERSLRSAVPTWQESGGHNVPPSNTGRHQLALAREQGPSGRSWCHPITNMRKHAYCI